MNCIEKSLARKINLQIVDVLPQKQKMRPLSRTLDPFSCSLLRQTWTRMDFA
jgi:hypothetical protein